MRAISTDSSTFPFESESEMSVVFQAIDTYMGQPLVIDLP